LILTKAGREAIGAATEADQDEGKIKQVERMAAARKTQRRGEASISSMMANPTSPTDGVGRCQAAEILGMQH